jgi:pyruvate,water dikinase
MEKEDQIDFVKWFSELDKSSGRVAGGKGANLSEIYNLKVPVPPGFVITAQAYDYFVRKAGLDNKIHLLLSTISYENTKQLDEVTHQIRTLIAKSEMPQEMERDILDAYDILSFKDTGISSGPIHNIFKNAAEPAFVAVRSSATTEDLAEASFAGQQDTFLNIKGKANLIDSVKKCFASLFTSRATYYRIKKGFKHEQASLAVVVQKMVDSDKSGVIFSKDPSYKNERTIVEAVWGLGEGIVSGAVTPDTYLVSPEMKIIDKKISTKKVAYTRDSAGNDEIVKLREEKANAQVLKDHEIIKLATIAKQLEEHYKKPQDIEFAIESDEIFIVQTRPITTMGGRIDKREEIKGEEILHGLAASPGIGSGVVKIVHNLDDLEKIKKGDVMVTIMTNPDMVVAMQKSAAIVTDEGGLTAHAAIVSREMGIPAVVGTQEATHKLKDGDIITVDGYTGKVYKGKVGESHAQEILPVTAKTRTKIKVIVDLPHFAERAAKTGLRRIGLTRMEGIIAESGKHPEYFVKKGNVKDYEEIIYQGVHGIAKYFDEIVVRTSDIRTDEYQHLEGAPQQVEANPMLGMHGIRYSLKHPNLLRAELNALKRVAKEGKTIGILIPQVIMVEELVKTKEMLKEINFHDARVGVMIETPAAVQIIKELCEEGLDFISFGTNDLTQYMLAIDRGNEEVQYLYNEMHPSVLYQLEYVIRVCKRNNVETSICGQAGSRKEMAKFLVERGIDSITVNADKAAEIAECVAGIEKSLVAGTDKEPRKYQPEQKNEKQKNEERIKKDIEAIEQEKEEYLKEHPGENVFEEEQ